MKLWPLVAVLAASSAAHAEHVRVTVNCTEWGFVSPSQEGLELRVDGVAPSAVGEDTTWANDTDGVAVVTGASGVGYEVAPGHHHLDLRTPDCAGSTDVDVNGPLTLTGWLTPTDDRLRGTAVLNEGYTLSLGSYFAWRSSTGYGDDTEQGAQLSLAVETRHFTTECEANHGNCSQSTVVVLDQMYGRGATSVWGSALRIGKRFAYRDVAFSGGVGIGADMVAGSDWHFFTPVWATLEYKPFCDWGVEATGTYEIHPTAWAENAPIFGAGVMWQPSGACSEPKRLESQAGLD